MRGCIGFEQYEVHCHIGATAAEREQQQLIYIDMKLEIDFSMVAESDSLHDTVDYTAIAALCSKRAQSKQYHLLETYAAEVLQEVLSSFKVSQATMVVRKPGAMLSAACSFVELSMRRGEV